MPQFNEFWTKHTDKVLHFAAGFTVYLVGFGIGKTVLAAALAVAIIALAKEVYDMFKGNGGKFDVFDILATLAGGGVGAIAFDVMKRIN